MISAALFSQKGLEEGSTEEKSMIPEPISNQFQPQMTKWQRSP